MLSIKKVCLSAPVPGCCTPHSTYLWWPSTPLPTAFSSANAGATKGEDVLIHKLEQTLLLGIGHNSQHVMEEKVDKLQIFSEGFTRTVFKAPSALHFKSSL